MKAIITYDYGKEKIDQIRALGYEVEIVLESNDRDEEKKNFCACSKDAEILVCYNPFESLKISDFPQLAWIQLSSIGIDQLPVREVIEREIVVTNNKGGYSIPMGEWIVFKMLEAYKYGKAIHQAQLNKTWKMNTKLRELKGKTVVFLGTGTIATKASKRLESFEMTRIGINRSGHKVTHFDEIYPIDQLEMYARLADFLVICVPATKSTEHLIDSTILNVMKSDSVLINVARGIIINEIDLIESLSRGKFLSVALDVFETEPLPNTHPLWGYEQVSISSHNSWISEMRNERRFDMIYQNLKSYAHDKKLDNIVNLKKGY